MIAASGAEHVGLCSPVPAGVVWFDLDSFDENLAADLIEEIDGEDGIPVRRRGQKGFAQPFQIDPDLELPNKIYLDGKPVADLLHGEKRQVVLPPTIHPDTGQPYTWLTSATLENTRPEDLPVMTGDLLAGILDVIGEYGEAREFREVKTPRRDYDGSDSDYRFRYVAEEVNRAALDSLSAWVPGLPVHASPNRSGEWHGITAWIDTGRSLEDRLNPPNLGFSPNGIKCFSTDEGFTPIKVVSLALDISYTDALWWLKDAVDPWPPLHPALSEAGQ